MADLREVRAFLCDASGGSEGFENHLEGPPSLGVPVVSAHWSPRDGANHSRPVRRLVSGSTPKTNDLTVESALA